MTVLKITKRSQSSINTAVDFNPSVFRYFVAGIEVKLEVVKNGQKPAFFGMLDVLITPNSYNFDELGEWSVLNLELTSGTGGSADVVVNDYTDVKYAYFPSTETQLTPLVPAKLNGFTGKTYRAQMGMMGFEYIETTDLNLVTHAEFLDPGYPPEIVDIEVVGGEPRILPTFSTTPSGYYPVSGSQVGTHGKDGAVFRPLSFWDRAIQGDSGTGRYKGLITDGKSGFTLDSSKIGLHFESNGEVLTSYSPLEVATFAELIKMHYSHRINSDVEVNI